MSKRLTELSACIYCIYEESALPVCMQQAGERESVVWWSEGTDTTKYPHREKKFSQ